MNKSDRVDITLEDLEQAKTSVWDFGNNVLYDLCRKHPKHTEKSVIIAKIWLIGRSYAAAIERRKPEKGKPPEELTSDEFYEKTVGEGKWAAGIDEQLKRIPDVAAPENFSEVVEVHQWLTNEFRGMTRQDNRSLASKYLHFHKPNAFFIYDSRASKAISRIGLKGLRNTVVDCKNADKDYLNFVRKCLRLRDQYKALETPRQIDNLLLAVSKRITKARINPLYGAESGGQ